MDRIEWNELTIPIFPWDDESILRYRISPTPRFIRLREDLDQVLQSRISSTTVHFRNLRDWLREEASLSEVVGDDSLLALYLRLRIEAEKLSERDWKTLRDRNLLPKTSMFHDMSFDALTQQVQREIMEDEVAATRAQDLMNIFIAVQESDALPHTTWTIDHHRLRYILKEERSLDRIFNEMSLPMPWLASVLHQQFYQWGARTNLFCRVRRDTMMDSDLYDSIKNDVERAGLYLFYPGLDAVTIRTGEKEHQVLLEIDNADLLEETLDVLNIASSRIVAKDDVGMVGSIVFHDNYVDLPLFQDACMNDPVISHFFYIHELRRQSSDKSLSIRFTTALRSGLGITALETDTADLILQNFHRTTGYQVQVVLKTPISEQNMDRFFFLLERLMGYYHSHREKWLADYEDYISDMSEILEKKKKMLIKKEVRSDRTQYVTKYPGMFVPALYKVICQKKLQPELLTEEEKDSVPPERVMKFPPEKIGDYDPEYYYCPNDDFPHPGLREMDLSGKNTFINFAPCCFNSSQKKENEANMKRIRLKAVEEDVGGGGGGGKNPVMKNAAPIEGKMIIKMEGQLGYIDPPNINRILLAVDPFCEYYRIGIEQSPSSFLSCMLMRKKLRNQNTRIDMTDLRQKIADHPGCAEACIQENPGLSLDDIRRDLADISLYFDPRRFYRAVEVFFDVRLVVFVKPQEIKPRTRDADLMEFIGPRTPYTLDFPKKKIVILFEHWGGKTNILSKLPYPHSELIVFKSFTDTKLKTDLEPTSVFRILDGVRLWLDGKTRICPMETRDSWFFKYVVGQVVDPLGKVRMLLVTMGEEEAPRGGGVEETKTSSSADKKTIVRFTVDPPLAILDHVPVIRHDDKVTLDTARITMDAEDIIPFLQRFSSWTGIHLRSDDDVSVLWRVTERIYSRLLGSYVPHVFTVNVRLPVPRQEEIESRSPLLRYIITVDKNDPSRMFFEEEETKHIGIRDMHMVHLEKTARCLEDLSLYFFHSFLQKNKLVPGGIDPDEILDRFRQQHIVIDRVHVENIVIDTEESADALVRKNRLLLPSTRFWQKIRYRIKWILFNNPSYFLSEFLSQLPSFYRRITDFTFREETFLCHLEHLGNIFKHSIQQHYPLLDMPLEEIDASNTTSTSPILWYHPNESPLAHPCLLYSFPTPEARRVFIAGIASEGYGDHDIHEWSRDMKKWYRIQTGTTGSGYFLATGKENLALLLQ